jgi:hypothetical protein
MDGQGNTIAVSVRSTFSNGGGGFTFILQASARPAGGPWQPAETLSSTVRATPSRCGSVPTACAV